MKQIKLSNDNRAEFQHIVAEYEHNKHIAQLENFFVGDSFDLEKMLSYGLPFLPHIVDVKGNKNLDLLQNFKPEVVGYYEILSRMSFLPQCVTDLCSDLSAYANGESVELMSEVYEFSPQQAIDDCVSEIEKTP